MEDNAFPFGAKFGADQYETIEEEWRYYFNYGQGFFHDVTIFMIKRVESQPQSKDIVRMK